MKKYLATIYAALAAALLGGPFVAFAVQISVPSAPGFGFALVSTSTGAYVPTTTDPFHAGSFFAASTATSTFNGGLNLLTGCFSINGVCAGSGSGVTGGVAGYLAAFTGPTTIAPTSSISVGSFNATNTAAANIIGGSLEVDGSNGLYVPNKIISDSSVEAGTFKNRDASDNIIFQPIGSEAASFHIFLSAPRTYTYPDKSGTITLGIGSGGRVSFWSNSNTMTSDSVFTYDSAAQNLAFTYGSTTALSATTFCLSTDCRTVWPSGSGGAAYSFTPGTFGSLNTSGTTTALVDYPGLVAATSTFGTITASSSITNQGVKSALVLNSATGLEGAYTGSSNPCSANQAPTTLSALGALGGCTSTFLTAALTDIGLGFGGTTTGPKVTLATSTATANGLTYGVVITSGTNNFTFTPTISGTYNGQAGSVANAVTFNNGGSGAASGNTFNGSGALTVSYNTIGALSTSTAAVIGNIPYFSGVNTFANVATGTITCTGGASCGAGSSVIGSNLTINSLGYPFPLNATTTQLAMNGGLTASTELVGSSSVGVISASSTATSTFTGGIQANIFRAASTTASSTAENGWNLNAGCFAIRGVCVGGSGSGSVTSVGLSLPTGFTITNSPVTGAGTLTATLSTGFSIRELPSYVVAASGGDFTTIQGALDAAGAVGGGSIVLTDATYAQAGTGLLFKSSNTNIYCRTASTTITFTGATTGFKTNSAAGVYQNNGIHGCVLTGDGNANSTAIDGSDMGYSTYDHNIIDNVGRGFKFSDTQNTTFGNLVSMNNLSTIITVGFDASSTNPFNGNVIDSNFIGCGANNCVGLQLTNANGNTISNNKIEADQTKTGVVEVKIFDNAISSCNGVFNNVFENNYIEGGLVTGTQGISIATPKCPSGGIQRNRFANNTNENNTLDYAFPGASGTSSIIALQTWDNNYNSNFGRPLTSFQGPFGIGTSTELANITATPFAFFAVAASSTMATNEVAIGNDQGRTDFTVTTSGNGVFNNTLSVLGHFITVIAAAFTPGTAGEIGIDTTDNQLKYLSNAVTRVLSPDIETSFTIAATSTALTGTSTYQLGPAVYAQTWNKVVCYTDVGTVNVVLTNAGSNMNQVNASTTKGTNTLSSNNAIAAGASRSVTIGGPASSPTYVSCTVSKTRDAT